MSTKSISYYVTTDKDQQVYFDSLDSYELLEWVVALAQMALDSRNMELARPLDLQILESGDVGVPY
jgi:hypothetical protein